MKIAPEIERKFLVRDAALSGVEGLKLAKVRSIYLDADKLKFESSPFLPVEMLSNSDTLEVRVAHKEVDGQDKYSLTAKTGGPELERLEAKTKITKEEFEGLADEYGAHEINKQRFEFDYDRRTFELELIPDLRLMLLEVEFDEGENTVVSLPPFVDVQKEVTGDPKYYSANMAKHVSLVKRVDTSGEV